MDVFQALFKGVRTRFGLRIVEKCLEHAFEKVGTGLPRPSFGEHGSAGITNRSLRVCVRALNRTNSARGVNRVSTMNLIVGARMKVPS